MFEIRKEAKFEAAHQIEGHKDPITGEPGKCSRLHGHSYKIGVSLIANELVEPGFVMDYYWLGAILKGLADRWDHHFLNDFPEFSPPHNSTAEHIALYIFEQVDTFLSKADPALASHVSIKYTWAKETDGTEARYYPDEVDNV